jgi:trans-2,3-dihydro-3-hydroxyanthranilate isomerase
VLRYDVVDVFTDRAFAGNPLAVVHGTADLSGAQLHALAREFNLSETVFPAAPTTAERAAGADYRVRIFTPGGEIPFAGHPSIGAAWVLRREGVVPAGLARQACGAGIVALRTDPADGLVELSAPPRGVSAPYDPEPALSGIGLLPADAQGRLRVAGCGLDFGYVPVSAAALSRAAPSAGVLERVAPRRGGDPLAGLCLYSSAEDGSPEDGSPRTVSARVFCPDVGVLEDPATGSAALGLGQVLYADGLLSRPGADRYVVSQGVELGRPSLLYGRVSLEGDAVSRCHVAGHVVPVARGEIAAPRP